LSALPEKATDNDVKDYRKRLQAMCQPMVAYTLYDKTYTTYTNRYIN